MPMPDASIIYIVDDDPDDQLILMEVLREINPQVACFTANNGQDGLKKLRTAAVPVPSLIFLDLNMPRINGRQMLTDLKADPNFKTIPVIICTTSSNPRDIADLKTLGAFDYIVKQSDDAVLKERLIKIMQYA